MSDYPFCEKRARPDWGRLLGKGGIPELRAVGGVRNALCCLPLRRV